MNVVHKNVLVEISSAEQKEGGLIIPQEEQERKNVGVVVKIGNEVPKETRDLLAHNPTVHFKEQYEEPITLEGKVYLTMSYEDILIIE